MATICSWADYPNWYAGSTLTINANGDRTMTSIIKVDQIQTLAGAAPTAADLGINVSGAYQQIVYSTSNTNFNISSTVTQI